MKSFQLDDQQHAAVIAALRLYQTINFGNRDESGIDAIATNGGTLVALDDEGIDDLIEHLQFDGEVALEKFKADFDAKLAAMSDEELVASFAAIGATVEIRRPQPPMTGIQKQCWDGMTAEHPGIEELDAAFIKAFDAAASDIGPACPDNGLLILTEDQFDNRYGPEGDENGDLYRQREWSVPEDVPVLEKAVAENRCWTAVDDDDGDFCIVEGNRMVNRIYNIVTERPLEDATWCVQVSAADAPEVCDSCGAPTDDGEGYDGLCGNCADVSELHHGRDDLTGEADEAACREDRDACATCGDVLGEGSYEALCGDCAEREVEKMSSRGMAANPKPLTEDA